MDEVLRKEELFLIFNEATRLGISEFTVEEPYFNTKMLEITLKGASADITLSPKDAFQRPSSLSNYWDSSDIPSFYDYKDCLISSGLVKYDNWKEFEDWIAYLYRSETDSSVCGKSVYLSIDTNLAYFRLLSRRFPVSNGKHVITANDFDYVMSSIVEGEIDHRIMAKYGETDLKMMGMYTKIGDIRFNFRNRGKLATRKAKFATQELNYLRETLNSIRVKATSSKTDSEKNDIRIVESLENFAWSKDIILAIISADRNMGNHAENAEIPYFILELPHRTSKTISTGMDVLLNLLHDLALIFGAIRIPELETVLFGIWGGKTDQDYRNESIQAWINANSKIEKSIKRDLKLIKGFSKS